VDVLIDTNVILRRLSRAHPQHRQARDAITKLSEQGDRICVTSQILIELWAASTRPVENNGLGLAPNQAERIVARVEGSVFRLHDSDDTYQEWRRLVVTHGVCGKQVHDARLVAAMIVHKIGQILTFNAKDFARYAGIEVLNPVDL
jgi:predicted nucleic acid-binding protein